MRLTTILLLLVFFASKAESFDDVYRTKTIPKYPSSLKYGSTSLYDKERDLIISYDNKEFLLFQGSKEPESGPGEGIALQEVSLWDSTSSRGLFFGLKLSNWYSAASNYGESYTLEIFQIKSERNIENRIIKFGSIDLGSSGKGFNKELKYIFREAPGLGVFEILVMTPSCYYFTNTSCAFKKYVLDENKKELVESH